MTAYGDVCHVRRYVSGYRYVRWASVTHRLKPDGLTSCGLVPSTGKHGAQWFDDTLDEHDPATRFCARCAERVACIDPISGVDYEHGDCEACGCWSIQLVSIGVPSDDSLMLCPGCRDRGPY